VRYHQYVQLVAEDQLGEISGARGSVPAVRRPGTGLYLDFPLGVSPGGYDTWRYRDAFAHDASVGAPPDVFFSRGQDWGFPPTHPERQREDGYTYLRAALRNLLRHAGSLRIDHVMGLHRLYWVPPGSDARDGVYVQYRAAELYAILALESHRAGAAVVGEDLGTVPRYVQQAMARHGILRSYVLQLAPLAGSVGRPPPLSVASLNTHDLPTFAGFWQGLDIEDRLAKGLLDPKDVRKERSERARQRKLLRGALREAGAARDAHPGEAIAAALRYLAASPSRMVVVNLEDLWGEAEPQNRPGTGLDQPNWRRKASRPLESFRSDEAVLGTLKEIDRLRRRQETTRGSP
jgi:4-alpha-glucanotransferase